MTLIHSKAFKQGISFGVVSSTMTVLGVSLGTWASGGKIAALIATILGLSISNSFADAFSIYLANTATSDANIALSSALVTGAIELLLPFIFTIPLIFLKLKTAIIVNVILGFLIIAFMGYYVSVLNKLSGDIIIGRIFLYIIVLAGILVTTLYSGKLTLKLQPAIEALNRKFTS